MNLKPLLHLRTISLACFLAASVLSLSTLSADPGDTTKAPSISRYYDNSWAFELDSLMHLHYYEYDRFTTDTALLNTFGYDSYEAPSFPNEFYVDAYAKLSANCPIQYRYDEDVKRWIELYTLRRRSLTSRVLGLSEVYFPIFEAELDRQGLPMELKYLAIIESALNPVAISRAGAGGLWQFMPGTARLYGLEVGSVVDERADPYIATQAAVRHLKDLYNIFGDWLLVVAAYNSGSGNVKKAMRLSGGDTFWEIKRFLPAETRGYVPAFIAVSYVMQNPERYNVYPITPGWKNYEIDTVRIDYTLSFKLISDSLGIPVEEISLLNPSYLKGYIPASKSNPRVLALPLNYMGPFMKFEPVAKAIAESGTMPLAYSAAIASSSSENVVHVVKRGESLGVIANKYHTSVTQIKKINNLKSNTIHPGQRLYVSKTVSRTPAPPRASMASGERDVFDIVYEYHVVQEGETLQSIAASDPNITIDELLRINRDLPTDSILPTGTKIRLREIQP